MFKTGIVFSAGKVDVVVSCVRNSLHKNADLYLCRYLIILSVRKISSVGSVILLKYTIRLAQNLYALYLLQIMQHTFKHT